MTEYIEREAVLNILASKNAPWDGYQKVKELPAADVLPIPDGDIGEVSDGYHTFNGLYYQRMVLFAALVKQNKDKSWKSLRHEDGELCFGGGWFIVGIDTPSGSYTYHYEDNFWSMFDCQELPVAKHWDGHTEKDVTRLLSLADVQPVKWIPVAKRLPEDNGFYLCLYEAKCSGGIAMDEGLSILQYLDNTWHLNEIYTVTHWMPLPEPPKDGDDNG